VPDGRQIHVALCQWGLGCYERYLCGDGGEWLDGALAAAGELVDEQQLDGRHAGGWVHRFALGHSFRLDSPWLSAMAQGEGASLLTRAWLETGEQRFADAAVRALEPMKVAVRDGGVRATLGGAGFPEEYPTRTGSYVLNGCIFALWGCYDVAQAIGDPGARELFDDGVAMLEREIHRYDLGFWSRYDLFPHPVVNVASSAYHLLHINQLRALAIVAPRPAFTETADRFEHYSRLRRYRARAFARKSLFRLLVPRNELLSRRLPWSQWAAGGDVLVLCYHAVSDEWPAVLAVTPEDLDRQMRYLTERGYHGATFHEAVSGAPLARHTVAVTFDDAYRSVYELAAPILDRYDVPATVFVPSSYAGSEDPMEWAGIDRWLGGPHERELLPMSWEQLAELADRGWEIGSHTVTHPRLTSLDDETLASELTDSRLACERSLGRPCLTLAYPYGDEDERVEAAAEAAGYSAAAALPHPRLHRPSAYRWPRIGVYGRDGMTRFKRKVSPLMRRARRSPLWAIVQARHRVTGLRRPRPDKQS
jgi:peptidoglycan/xylan/chitin deacetylase (PgdA/CDA1 family)